MKYIRDADEQIKSKESIKSQQISATPGGETNRFAMIINQKQQQQPPQQPLTFESAQPRFQAQQTQPQSLFFNQPQVPQFQPAPSPFFQQPQSQQPQQQTQQQQTNSFQNNFFNQPQQSSPFTNIAQPQQTTNKFVHPSFGAQAALGTQMSTTEPFGQFPAQMNAQATQINQNSTRTASGFFSAIPTNGSMATHGNTNIYSSVNELSSQDVEEYRSNMFVIGRIPHEPPPKEFC